MLGPTFETTRLILRPPGPQDFEPWAAMMVDPEAARFIGGAVDRALAWRGMTLMAGAWITRGFSNFSLIEKASGRWIGRAGPWQPEGWPGTEIGWALDRSAWGRGYATEAAARCVAWAFEDLGWREVIHVIHPENLASIAVAERLGSHRLGTTSLPPPHSGASRELYGQRRD